MDRRRDAPAGLHRAGDGGQPHRLGFRARRARHGGHGANYPNSRNVVPGRVFFAVEFRHPQSQFWNMEQRLLAAVNHVNGGLTASPSAYFQYPPIAF